MLKKLGTLLVTLGLSSCGVSTETTSELNGLTSSPVIAPKEINVLIVLSQGFHSCTNAYKNLLDPVHDHAEKIRKDLEKQYSDSVTFKIAYMEICFTGGLLDDFKPEIIFHEIRHANGIKTRRLQAGPSTISHIIQTVADDLGKPENPTHVYLIGHSHGAWLMMKTAQAWRPDSDLRRLFTIDAISYERCTQSYLIANRLAKNVTPFAMIKDYECTRFPTDLVPHSQTIRKKISGQWTNFFQNQFFFVHSSGNPYADSNRELDYTNMKIRDFAHKAILGGARVWKSVMLQIQGDLEAFAAAQP